MTPGMVALILAAAVVGILWVYVPRWVKFWRKASRLQDEQIRDALAPGDFKRWNEEFK